MVLNASVGVFCRVGTVFTDIAEGGAEKMEESIEVCQYLGMVARTKSESTAAPACCQVLSGLLQRDDAERLSDLFKALSDPARVQILSVINAQPKREACVCNLVDPLELSQPTVSHHLKVLHEAGLLDRERRGTWIYYRVRDEGVAALRDALT